MATPTKNVTITPNLLFTTGSARAALTTIGVGPIVENPDGKISAKMTDAQILQFRNVAGMHKLEEGEISAVTPLPLGVPTAGTPNGFVGAGGGTIQSPRTGDVWTNATGEVIAVYGLGGWTATASPIKLETHQMHIASGAAGTTIPAGALKVPAAGIPSTGAATGYRNTGGGTLAVPKNGDTWVNAAGAVVATFAAGAWVAAPGSQRAVGSAVPGKELHPDRKLWPYYDATGAIITPGSGGTFTVTTAAGTKTVTGTPPVAGTPEQLKALHAPKVAPKK
jgi:hypothetical protein